MATITGVAGSAINAVCTVANDGTEITQAEQTVTAEAICNDLATIKSGSCTIAGVKTFSAGITLGAACVVTGVAGCSFTGAVGFGAALTITCAAGAVIAGSLSVTAAVEYSGASYFSGRIRKAARVTLADGNATVAYAAGSGVTDVGTRFLLPDPTPTRTITLKSTTVVPGANEVYEFFFPATVITGTATKWTFQREDASTIASFVTDPTSTGAGRAFMWAEFEYSGGVWRLAGNSGAWVDLVGNADYGVVPGASM